MPRPRFPVKFVDLGEVVNWSSRLADRVSADGFEPDAVVAVGRGGAVVARFLADLLGVGTLVLAPVRWVEVSARPCERYLADLVRGWVRSSREGRPVWEYVGEVVSRLRVSVDPGISLDLSGRRALLVEEIVATGAHITVAKDLARRWGCADTRSATLVWKSSTASVRPDYFLVEARGFVWFQFPWSRLEDYKQFVKVMLEESSREVGRAVWSLREVEELFNEWYGREPDRYYLRKALQWLSDCGTLKLSDSYVEVRLGT